MGLSTLALEIGRGLSVDLPIRIETDDLVYVAMNDMEQSAPLRVEATAHGLPDGWRAAIMNASGMTEVNVPWDRLRERDLRRVATVDVDHVDFVDINATAFQPYTGGGQLVYYQPLDLTNYTGAEMTVRPLSGGDPVVVWSTEDSTMEIDSGNAAAWLRLTDEQSGDIDAGRYTFELKLLRSDGGIDAACASTSTLTVLPF